MSGSRSFPGCYRPGSALASTSSLRWYLRRRSQRGHDLAPAWQSRWKTVLHSLHLKETEAKPRKKSLNNQTKHPTLLVTSERRE